LPRFSLCSGGGFQFLMGLSAVLNDRFFVQPRHNAFRMEPSAWGWVHMGFGVVMTLSGLGLLTRNAIARAVACTVATLSAVWNFLLIPDYPIWAISVIALDLAVLWAVIAHGGEQQEARDSW
jgi:hypothetical protein